MLEAVWVCHRCNWSGKTEDMPYKETSRGVERVCPICKKNDEVE